MSRGSRMIVGLLVTAALGLSLVLTQHSLAQPEPGPAPASGKLSKGQLVSVTTMHLVAPGSMLTVTKRIDDEGQLDLPYAGTLAAADLTLGELEDNVVERLRRENVMRDAIVIVTRPELGESVELQMLALE